MVNPLQMNILLGKAARIKLVITDVDGVLTDGGVYYSSRGEELKCFSLRDGMGVQRLRELCQVETAIITSENSEIVSRRAEKLLIREIHLGVKDKLAVFQDLCTRLSLQPSEVAYIGDDYNDLEVLKACGLSAAPADALPKIRDIVDFVTEHGGGHGAFRDLAELIIQAKSIQQKNF